MTTSAYCSRCGRVDDEMGPDQCGSSVLGCPPPTPFDAAKQALAKCGPCGKTRAVPIGRVMKGMGNLEDRDLCEFAECKAVLVLPVVEKTERLVPPALTSAPFTPPAPQGEPQPKPARKPRAKKVQS